MSGDAPEAPLRVGIIGLGQMGRSHALAYHANPGFEIVAMANRSAPDLPGDLRAYPLSTDVDAVFAAKPDLVSVNTYSDAHADLAIRAMEQGAHVFVEKPLAPNVADARRVVDCARATGRKLVIGYILRHHPSWIEFIARARALGGPYVFRMNLNQQSSGPAWEIHKRLMEATSPVVDCGVHYLDVMCQITDARPVQVRGMGVRLSDEIGPDMVNYGHLQVLFDDGSVGWYEAGWGPMISETAFFVKDVMSPAGCVSIVMDEGAASADIDTHTRTARIRIHSAERGADGRFAEADRFVSMEGEPGHQDLCDREQAFVLKAIREDMDLTRHMEDAVRSLEIALAADRGMRENRAIDL
ncbi:Predicted dehydrogenase [Faunimonas pinastri]|uniref:Predicted dehydrogenase n=1 Tax=Faunimonas pinastri TaxID=1855383 RepID=A0A1H9ACA0_9HYPH|nr:Gfo/Idh/MocA family oxidoreductase [Faunimonas pinastri]SEP74245.1 Predicted dehydrogenase [Faunimonas pinastri]